MVSTKSHTYVSSTASAAGGCERKSITGNSDHVVRLEELAKSQVRLINSGLVSRSDELASARRRFQSLTGPSGIDLLKLQLMEGSVSCWRDKSSDRQQAVMSLRNLREGLQKLRMEGWRQRKVMRSRVSDTQYWRVVDEIRKKSSKTRSKENKCLRRKEQHLRRRDQ